ncbi:MAG: hypothetical protein N4A44_04360 [Alphaproteobacteria bacterium]|nr:hypothetical protein [Alphaproteobacteria bacterium]
MRNNLNLNSGHASDDATVLLSKPSMLDSLKEIQVFCGDRLKVIFPPRPGVSFKSGSLVEEILSDGKGVEFINLLGDKKHLSILSWDRRSERPTREELEKLDLVDKVCFDILR